MPDAPKMPSIPMPAGKEDDATRYEAILALKMVVEMMMGTRGQEPVTRTFIGEKVPVAYNVGDQWIQPSSGKMSYWNGDSWHYVRGA